jgi:molybdopterin converting factor small subunit
MEVWNQPVVAFDTQMAAPQQGATPGAAEGTVQEVYVKTVMYYIAEVPQSWEAGFNKESIGTKVYEYILELDKEGSILGGRWISSDRPDFMWTQDRPKFTKYFAPLKELYKESVKHLNSLEWIGTVNRVMTLKEKLKKARAALNFRKITLQNVRVNNFVDKVKSKRRLAKLKKATNKLKV